MATQFTDSFTLPFTFPGVSSLRANESDTLDTRNTIEASLSNAQPTVLEYWDTPDNVSQREGGTGMSHCGAVVGCADGTLYIFHTSCQPTDTVELRLSEASQAPRPKSPLRVPRGSYATSRSSSPVASSFNLSTTPFNVTPRSRVVSGISAEQVEAPKNYVDFEDEPDKLKDMLRGKSPRDKAASSDTSSERRASLGRSPLSPTPESPVPRRKEAPKSLLSATNSRAPTPKSFSAPSSPREFHHDTPHELTLRCHVVPPTSGPNNAVSSLKLLNHGQHIIVLQETGNLYILSTRDGSCIASANCRHSIQEFPVGITDKDTSSNAWLWRSLSASYSDESTYLLVSATSEAAGASDIEGGVSDRSMSVIFRLYMGGTLGPYEVKLVYLNHWDLDESPHGIGIHEEPDKSLCLFSINSEGHFLVRQLHPRPPSIPPQPMNVEEDNHSTHLASLPIPNPFKAMNSSRSAEHIPLLEDKEEKSPKVLADEMHDVGVALSGSVSGLTTRNIDGKLLGIAWTSQELAIFEYQQRAFCLMYHASVSDIREAAWLHHNIYALSFEDRVEVFEFKLVNADNDAASSDTIESGLARLHPQLLRTIPIEMHDAVDFASSAELIVTRVPEDGRRQLLSFYLTGEDDGGNAGNREVSRTLWQSAPRSKDVSPKIELTAMLALDVDLVVHGYTDGRIRLYSLPQMCRRPDKLSSLVSSSRKTSKPPLGGNIIGLHVVQNPRTNERFILGGADDGSIAFCNFELCARWIVFTTPLAKVIQFQEDKVGPLRGCVLCISQDGTIAAIVTDGFHFLFLVPGAATPLQRICLGGNNLLLIYEGRVARLWDVQTKEFWRSMTLDKADELMDQGGWADLSLATDACVPDTVWRCIAGSSVGRDAVSTLSLDLERLDIESIAVTKSISTSRDQTRTILQTLDRLRLLLGTALTPGLNDDVDSICHGKLGVYRSSVSIGFRSMATTIFTTSCPQEPWCISGDVTASRAVAIILVLRAMSLFEELLEGANAVISFYATSLGPCVGPLYQPPSLAYLGRRWFNASNELRQAIRIVFDATVARMSDEEAIGIAEQWQHHLPCLQPDAEKESITAALALFICGYVASEKYSLLSTNALTDISKSITLYLHDEKSIYRVLAIDLCSRGFHVWQHYIDAMEILRSLFTLATNTRKDSISVQNVASQARLAVLLIASNNTPLFMTTLCLDILTPPTLDHRRSVMQIVAFLIRKRPLVLQPNLPRLMEAVVKSLDPNSTTNRDAVLDTATEIIGYVVKTFPTVDFHMATQRLAVGSSEGAIVMYDLKTAIRLYVLEGHKKQLTACSFSPDGRRLVTLSLEESVVLVWKVGSSFSSFFNPGAPPRQGHGGSEPFKTLNFNIGAEADMSVAETFHKIRFEWVADRNVRLKIRESVLTFST